MFNIDFNKIITWMLPIQRRWPGYFAWMQVLCAGVVSMYNEFMVKRAADLYDLAHDSRVFSIEAVLNDQFDNALRRIYIADGFGMSRIYIYTPAENKPLYLNNPVYLYNPGDYHDTGIDFIVWVPTVVSLGAQDMTLLVSLVNKYKLASKRFVVYRVILT